VAVDAVVRGLVRGLLLTPEDRALRNAILARGVDAVEPLIELLTDPAVWRRDTPDKGLAAFAAWTLLAQLRTPDAVSR
jgi:hypothetical protein